MSNTPLCVFCSVPVLAASAALLWKRAQPPPMAKYGDSGKAGASLTRSPGAMNSAD